MKKYSIIAALVIFAACGRGPDQAVITGQVNNPQGEKVEIFYVTNLANNDTEMVEVELDVNNRFEAVIPLIDPRFVNLRTSQRLIPLFVEPGADIQVVLDGSNRESIPVVSGEKSLESSLLVAYEAEVGSQYSYVMTLREAGNHTPEEFVEHAWMIYEEKIGYLESDHRYNELAQPFIDGMHTNILYDTYGLLLEYPAAARRFGQLEALELPANYYDFIEDAVVSNDDLVSSRPYFSFMVNYLRHYISENRVEGESRPMTRLQFDHARELFSGKIRDMIMAQQVNSGLNFGNFQDGLDMYHELVALSPTGKVLEMIEKEYETVMALAPGSPAPGFTLTDINGAEVSLDDFLGKVVYLDFWASWCGPCMQQVPYARELKKRMADQEDFVFLYISVDTDEQAWRNKVAEENIQGVHLNVSGFAQDVPRSYNLKGVPTFYLIGRDGLIFDNRPPRPSHDNVDEVLLSALAQ